MTIEALPTFTQLPHPHATDAAKRAELLTNPGFGRLFTDHMVTIKYHVDKGWYEPQVEPYGPITLDPAASVLHYAQEIFEGMKAYRYDDGGVGLFRPEANARRFNASAKRMSMPQLPVDLFMESIKQLVSVDKDWVPTQAEASLYLRPFMFATEAFLGVRPAKEFLYTLIASPAGAYFASGPKPVTIWVSREYTRAAPGGTGTAKCGGNYAASLAAQAEAIENGCDQVVFLDAVERKYVDELGGMNLFFVYENDQVIYTPKLGTILPGITRDAIISLAGEAGWEVREVDYSLDRWREDANSGALTEVFACGTAAVITPVGTVREADGDFTISKAQAGKLTMQLRQTLLDLQHGRAEDRHGWVQRLL
ncbi:branched-chain amino acid aminotransferase [Natronoglycomyces albus]|uniref:Branched-chain-amino-acid aminotransferase n=1 Tax=Natronoglycomyces albus TaxID=2811108 RepID=A0A895XDM6_9ACTN|nr:branched-chain amino acid aminotransferase [Natronoglycomyces albus]QSB03901.1 branched-chain amino acid aminotransferase [Natronoglycomyces albus]